MSALLIWFSFLTFLIPLALYHVAQISASMRLRTGFSMLFSVVGLSLLLGLGLANELFLLGGIVGLLWSPIIVISVMERKANHSPWLSLVLYFLPIVAVAYVAFRVPVIQDLWSALLQQKQSLLETISQQTDAASAQGFVDQWWSGVERLKQSPAYFVLEKVAGMTGWQRLLWLMFDPAASSFFVFGIVLNALASMVFLDHAFEQVDKFRAVSAFIVSNKSRFPQPLVSGIENYLEASKGLREEVPEQLRLNVISHRAMTEERSEDWKQYLIQPPSAQTVNLWGHRFILADAAYSKWKLRSFALPFPLALLAIAGFGGLLWKYKTPETLISVLKGMGTTQALLMTSACFVCLLFLCMLAVQGMLVAYQRLSPIALLVLIFVLMFVGWGALLDPYALVGLFGSIGLLDYLYDFRGRKQTAT